MSLPTWFESLFFSLLRASWQASILILLVLSLRGTLGRALRPEWRSWLWLLVFARLALPFSLESPLSIFNISRLQVPAALRAPSIPEGEPPAELQPVPPPVRFDPMIEERASSGGSEAVAQAPASDGFPAPPRWPWRVYLAIGWSAGAVALALRIVLSHRRLARRLRHENQCSRPDLLLLLQNCAKEVGLSRPPPLVETGAIASPGIFGFLSPKLLLPASTSSMLSAVQLRFVFLHELCHLRRLDLVSNWFATALQVLHWFNPLVWLASSRFRADRELACDARALSHLAEEETPEYGRTIIRLLEGIAERARVPNLIGIAEDLRHLEQRLAMIGRFARSPRRWAVLAAIAAAALGFATLTDPQAPGAGPRGSPHLDLLIFQACAPARSACACDPSPALQSAIEKATPTNLGRDGPAEPFGKKLGELRALVAQFPREVAVHRAYLRATAGRESASMAAYNEYRALAEGHPDDPLYLYLYAEERLWADRAAARRLLLAALEKDAAFVWPHLALGRLDSMEGKREDAVRHLRTFIAWCPCSIEALSTVIGIESTEEAVQDLPKLRELLHRYRSGRLGSYISLWNNEFELTEIPRHAEVRKRIAADLVRIRALNRVDDPEWWTILDAGYVLAWDPSGRDWVKKERARRYGSSPIGFSTAFRKWLEENPFPVDNAMAEQAKAYRQARLEQSAAWVRQWPDEVEAWMERFRMVNSGAGTSAADADAAAEGLLRALDKNPGAVPNTPPFPDPYLDIAGRYVHWGIHLDRVPGLIERVMRRLDAAAGTPRGAPGWSEGKRWEAWRVLADARIGMKQFDQARAILSQMAALLPKQSDETGAGYRAMQHRLLRGRLAEAENRKAEALALYQSVLPDPDRLFPSATADPLVARTAALWKELRRPAETWQSFLAELEKLRSERSRKAAPVWTNLQTPLPDFDLKDMEGRTWRLSELRGKVCFIQTWAVWSDKHNSRLQPTQQLHDRLAGRRDAGVLTLNGDQYTTQIEPWVKSKGYTFPVLPAHRFLRSFAPFTGGNRCWIVDRSATIRMELQGPLEGPDAVDETIALIDRIAQSR